MKSYNHTVENVSSLRNCRNRHGNCVYDYLCFDQTRVRYRPRCIYDISEAYLNIGIKTEDF